MRTILAAIAGLLVVGTYGVVQAQPTAPEKPDPNTKVYAYKKTAPQTAAERAKERERAAEPAYGTQEWWRVTKDRYSSGDGGS